MMIEKYFAEINCEQSIEAVCIARFRPLWEPILLKLSFSSGQIAILTNHFEQCFYSALGHIGFSVPDVEKTCDRFEKLGVTFVKKPNDGEFVLHTVFIFSLTTSTWP